METLRKPWQGVRNIVQFNWHFYALALAAALVLGAACAAAPAPYRYVAGTLLLLLTASVAISLGVSAYVYDFSDLYALTWLQAAAPAKPAVLSVSAGFDEISPTLLAKYAPSYFLPVDFYDPTRHTEVSIRRARRAYPPQPGTYATDSRAALPLTDNSIDLAFAFLAAHEIRDDQERSTFFRELGRVVKPTGTVVVTEHLRDSANFLAYAVGFLHFHSRRTWLATFSAAGLQVEQQVKTTPFVTTFLLRKNGSAA